MKKYLVILLLCLTVYTGCEKPQEILPPQGSYPYYLEGYLETNRFAVIHIDITTSIANTQSFYNIFHMDTDTIVQFYNRFNALLLKDGVVVDSLTGPYDNRITNYVYWPVSSNIYTMDWYYLKGNRHLVQPGGNYQMIVKRKGRPDMVATCVVPQIVPIESLDTLNNGVSWHYYPPLDSLLGPEPSINPSFDLTFRDPANQQNFYSFETYVMYSVQYDKFFKEPLGHVFNGTMDNTIFDNHRIDNDNTWEYSTLQGFFNDKLFNGQEKSFDFEAPVSDSIIIVDLVNISQGYYQRLWTTYLFILNSVNNQYASTVPIYNNFSNALGFLAGRAVATDTFNIVTLKSQSSSRSNNFLGSNRK